ncbi:MAG: hypothetical protein AAF653_18480, partial [Chloroflexota bacterium]
MSALIRTIATGVIATLVAVSGVLAFARQGTYYGKVMCRINSWETGMTSGWYWISIPGNDAFRIDTPAHSGLTNG